MELSKTTAVNNFILIVSTSGGTFVLFNLTFMSGSGEQHCFGGQRPKFEFWLCLTVVG